MQDAGDEAGGAAPPVGAEAGAKMADFVKAEQAGDAEEKGSVLAGLHTHAFVCSLEVKTQDTPDGERVVALDPLCQCIDCGVLHAACTIKVFDRMIGLCQMEPR